MLFSATGTLAMAAQGNLLSPTLEHPAQRGHSEVAGLCTQPSNDLLRQADIMRHS